MTEEQPTRTIDINELHAINERFNAFLAKKARREGRVHTKFQKLIDVDSIEYFAKLKAGLIAESQDQYKPAVKEEELPISEKTGKRKLAVWDPVRQVVTGYASEDDDEPFVKGVGKLLEIATTPETDDGAEAPAEACPSSGSGDSPRPHCDSGTVDPPNTPRD